MKFLFVIVTLTIFIVACTSSSISEVEHSSYTPYQTTPTETPTATPMPDSILIPSPMDTPEAPPAIPVPTPRPSPTEMASPTPTSTAQATPGTTPQSSPTATPRPNPVNSPASTPQATVASTPAPTPAPTPQPTPTERFTQADRDAIISRGRNAAEGHANAMVWNGNLNPRLDTVSWRPPVLTYAAGSRRDRQRVIDGIVYQVNSVLGGQAGDDYRGGGFRIYISRNLYNANGTINSTLPQGEFAVYFIRG